MKTNNKIQQLLNIAALAVLIGLASCADTYKWSDQVNINNAASWALDAAGTNYTYTKTGVKVFFKKATPITPITTTLYKISAADIATSVKVGFSGGAGTLLVNGTTATDGATLTIPQGTTQIPVSFTPTASVAATYVITLEPADGDAATKKKTTLSITTYRNNPPTAVFTTTRSTASDLKYVFNASTSSDTDGTIQTYKYVIAKVGDATQTQTIQTSSASYTFPFADYGSYTVTLTTYDNDYESATGSGSTTSASQTINVAKQ